ncbi:MAG: hypothetical protein C5B49_07320 [Bdellovibrio sp.]|nr:MAG: hypothetical protein C5B49_07320 [Bdellovibrio sp.]
MVTFFLVSVFLRWAIYYTVKRHEWFAREFEKRVSHFIEQEIPGNPSQASFYVLTKRVLERTFYEVFEMRDRLRRRRNDGVMSLTDRIFLVRQGAAWMIKDLLRQLKFLKWNSEAPQLQQITRATIHQNPCFNRVFGLFPMGATNDLISLAPGLFVVTGILGTFLGIAKGLPTLSGMNLSDLDTSKLIMDRFLSEIAFAMHSSILGISFSLIMHFYNTIFSPERAFVSLVDRFEACLDLIWNRADNNDFPSQDSRFADLKDPTEALASEAIQQEINKKSHSGKNERIGKAS